MIILFRKTVIATIYLDIDPTDLLYIMEPINAYNQSQVPANFTFINDIVQESVTNVGVKLKGSYTRTLDKKGFTISFKFVKGR